MHTARSSFRRPRARAARGARRARAPLAVLALALLAGCQSEGYRYRYEPMPAEADAKGARLLASVLGAKDGGAGQLDTMDVRFRLQSPPGVKARLLPEELRLLTADLQEFGPAQVIGGTLEAEGANVAVADVAFPYPDIADVNVRGLSLIWAVEVGGERVTGTTNFQKLTSGYYYNDPWYPPYYRDPWTWSVGFGSSWTHCH
jgi:hypothetical protein